MARSTTPGAMTSAPQPKKAAPIGGPGGSSKTNKAGGGEQADVASTVHFHHNKIHHHLAAAASMVRNPATRQHINAAGMHASAMHSASCPECADDEASSGQGVAQPPDQDDASNPGEQDMQGPEYGSPIQD